MPFRHALLRPTLLALAASLAASAGLTTRAATAPAPANDRFANALPILETPSRIEGTNAGASKEAGEPNHAGDPGGRSVWWTWTAPFDGSVVMHTTGSSFDTLLAVYTGTSVTTLTLVTANDQDLLDPLGADTSRVRFIAASGTVYRIAVDGFAGATGTIRLSVEIPPRPTNDAFTNATPVPALPARLEGTNRDATREPGEPPHDALAGSASIWWSWTAPGSGEVVAHTRGSDFDTVLAVYTGDDVADLTFIAANDQDPEGGDTSRVRFLARAGTRYAFAVDGWNGESGRVTFSLEPPPTPPRLQDAAVAPGPRFEFTISGPPGFTAITERFTPGSGGVPPFPVATNLVSAQGNVRVSVPLPPSTMASNGFFRARWR